MLLGTILTTNTKTRLQSGEFNADGILKLIGLIKLELKELPVTFEIVQKDKASPFLIIKSQKSDDSKPRITLSAHMDTVYSPDEVENRETGDKIFGAGAQDLKTSIFVIIEVLKNLHRLDKLHNITVSLSPEEEVATPNYRKEIEIISKNSDYILVFEPTINIDSSAEINTRSVITSRRGFYGYNLALKSSGGHSGVVYQKEKRHNTILKMSEIILKLEKLANYEKLTTVNPGKIVGGDAINIISPNCSLDFEVRFILPEEESRVKKEIKSLIESQSDLSEFEYELKEIMHFPSMYKSDANIEFIETCKEVAKKSGVILEEEIRGGGSEASLFQYYNPNAAVLDGFGIHGGGEHTKSEFVYKKSIDTTITFNTKILSKLL